MKYCINIVLLILLLACLIYIGKIEWQKQQELNYNKAYFKSVNDTYNNVLMELSATGELRVLLPNGQYAILIPVKACELKINETIKELVDNIQMNYELVKK